MNTYRQAEPHSCGPDAMAWAVARITGEPFPEAVARVRRAWSWAGYGDVRDDLLDSPGQHEAVARRLGIAYDLATLGELERGQLPAQTTVMLAHLSAQHPECQHWIVLDGYASNGRTRWHWGDGQVHDLSRESIRELYSRFTPACIYTLGESSADPLPWYVRAWAALMSWIFRR